MNQYFTILVAQLLRNHFPHLHNTKTLISLERKQMCQKGKRHSAVFFKSLQISSNYFSFHRHFNITSSRNWFLPFISPKDVFSDNTSKRSTGSLNISPIQTQIWITSSTLCLKSALQFDVVLLHSMTSTYRDQDEKLDLSTKIFSRKYEVKFSKALGVFAKQKGKCRVRHTFTNWCVNGLRKRRLPSLQ